jgi:transcriptional regulator with XRE-family HTH domain
MSKSLLQQNLERLIDEGRYNVVSLERKAGVTKNTVYNILKGITTKPSAEKLEAIAGVFGVSINDLYKNVPEKSPLYMNKDYFELMQKSLASIIREATKLELNLTCSDVSGLIDEIFHYSIANDIHEPDQRFVRWRLQEKFQKNRG